jgi:FlaG/FlaF family flagellin (archaellin)
MEDFTMKNEKDSAVSPVVGVMLMLVVTIIIAAVVSGFSGGLIDSGSQKTPTLSMDVSITNAGTYHDSGFHALVTGVSEPINTSELKLITSWTTTVKTNTYISSSNSEIDGAGCILSLPLDTVYHGGAEVVPGVPNTKTQRTYTSGKGVAPFGSGAGVEGTVPVALHDSYEETAYFGNYVLEQGTVMTAEPIGSCVNPTSTIGGYAWNYCAGADAVTPNAGGYGQTDRNDNTYLYQYKSDNGRRVYNVYTGEETVPADIVADGGHVDNTQAVLGCGWENLRSGDTVNVKVVYIPSGKTIFDKDVVVST